MNVASAYNTYKQNDMHVESPYKLIEMLYQGILKFNIQAKKAIQTGNNEKKVYWINRSNAIFIELMNSIDFSSNGTSANYLSGLYDYQINMLNIANLSNDSSKIDLVNNVIKGLLDAWRESVKEDLA